MNHLNRRQFLTSSLVVGAGILLLPAGKLLAQSVTLSTDDPMAKRLGYTKNTSTVDNQKYPKHSNEQRCAGCSQFQGSTSDPSGSCRLFAGKIVDSNGWCMSWNKKK